MTGEACPACRGNGIGLVIFHGWEDDGSECVEPTKCEVCDGRGYIDHYQDAMRAADAARDRRAFNQMTAQTPAQRKAAERQRRAEAGLVLVSVYAHPDDAQAIKAAAAKLARKRAKACAS